MNWRVRAPATAGLAMILAGVAAEVCGQAMGMAGLNAPESSVTWSRSAASDIKWSDIRRSEISVPQMNPSEFRPSEMRLSAPSRSEFRESAPSLSEFRESEMHIAWGSDPVAELNRQIREAGEPAPANPQGAPPWNRGSFAVGNVVAALPPVHVSYDVAGQTYYMFDFVFFRPVTRGTGNYEVVKPPPGLAVDTLPLGYTTEEVAGLTLYAYNDVYFLWDDSTKSYVVVTGPEQPAP